MRKHVRFASYQRLSRVVLVLGLATAAPWVCQADVQITEAQAKAAATVKPLPEYPAMARQLKVTGKVELTVIIDPTGKVEDVKIVSGNPMLTRPCVKATHEWQFSPFTDGGKPTRATAPLSFDFR